MPDPAARRERKKTRTRRAISGAALGLFRARGYEAVTVEEICAKADVARGTFFQHFPSKDALLREWGRQIAAELDGLLGGGASALAEYRAIVDRLRERFAAPPDLVGAALAEALRAEATGGSELVASLEAALRRGQQRGELRANVSPRLAAWLLLAGSAALAAGAGEERDELLTALLSGQREPKPRVAWKPRASPPA